MIAILSKFDYQSNMNRIVLALMLRFQELGGYGAFYDNFDVNGYSPSATAR
jgi:hypothetical protein